MSRLQIIQLGKKEGRRKAALEETWKAVLDVRSLLVRDWSINKLVDFPFYDAMVREISRTMPLS